MTEDERRALWAAAYARQAAADFRSYERLAADRETPASQWLHPFQMAEEKVCKAYRCRHTNSPEDMTSTHAVAEATLPAIVRGQAGVGDGPRTRHRLRAMTSAARRFGREVDLLAPSVEANGARPDNCEYPWESGGTVRIPCESDFPLAEMLRQPQNSRLIQTIKRAIDELS